jgi:hypothetical protein
MLLALPGLTLHWADGFNDGMVATLRRPVGK